MRSISTNQMQFWFMFFVSVIIWVAFFILCLKEKRMLVGKADWKNWTMYVFPVILIVADRFLFTALSQPDVLVSGVAIIKQLSTVVSVIFGGLLYKEPKLQYKLIYLAFILVGIVIVVIWSWGYIKRACTPSDYFQARRKDVKWGQYDY